MRQSPRVVVILGESGGGKSTVAKALVARDARVIVAQPYMKDAYGFGVVFPDYWAAKAALRANPDVKTARFGVGTFDPKELGRVCRLAWAIAPSTLVLDESAFVIPNAQAAPRELRMIAQVGRHAGHDEEQPVKLIALGQRPPNLPPYVLSEAKEVYLFPMARATDWDTVGDGFSLPGDVLARVLERGPRLPKYHRLRLTKRDDGGWDVQEGTGT